jgi:hypothetical protein
MQPLRPLAKCKLPSCSPQLFSTGKQIVANSHLLLKRHRSLLLLAGSRHAAAGSQHAAGSKHALDPKTVSPRMERPALMAPVAQLTQLASRYVSHFQGWLRAPPIDYRS